MRNDERAILEFITAEWKALPGPPAPERVWIRQYPPVPLDLDEIRDEVMVPQAVWMLDRHGLRPQSVWSWRRFFVIHSQRYWCQRFPGEHNPIFGERHEIGLAAFAPYLANDKFYVEAQWGNRFGRGWQVVINADGEAQCSRGLWVS